MSLLHKYEGVRTVQLFCLSPSLTSLAKSKEIMDGGLWMVGIDCKMWRSHTHTGSNGSINAPVNGRPVLVVIERKQEETARLQL